MDSAAGGFMLLLGAIQEKAEPPCFVVGHSKIPGVDFPVVTHTEPGAEKIAFGKQIPENKIPIKTSVPVDI
jgi:hypothetical protein